jgi:hypothetical protein
MTTDIAASGDPGIPPRGSGLDASNLGLFPQLIDVINAMTDGQELLAQKLRSVRVMHPGAWASTDDPQHEVRSDDVGPFPAGDAESNAAPVVLPAASLIMVDLSADSAPRHQLRGNAVVEPTHVAPAPVQPRLVDVVQDPTPTPTPTQTPTPTPTPTPTLTSTATAAVLPPIEETSEVRGRHARRQSQPLLAPEGIGAMTTAATRDYNFFDELDARLADLQDSD